MLTSHDSERRFGFRSDDDAGLRSDWETKAVIPGEQEKQRLHDEKGEDVSNCNNTRDERRTE